MKEGYIYPNQISIRDYGLAKAEEKVTKVVKKELPPPCFHEGIKAENCRAFINLKSLELTKERIKEKIYNSDSLLNLNDRELVEKLIFIGSLSNINFDKFSAGRLGRDNIIALPVKVIDERELPTDSIACVYLGNLTGDVKKDKSRSTHVINNAVSHPLTMSVGSQIFVKPDNFVSGRISAIYNRNSITHK